MVPGPPQGAPPSIHARDGRSRHLRLAVETRLLGRGIRHLPGSFNAKCTQSGDRLSFWGGVSTELQGQNLNDPAATGSTTSAQPVLDIADMVREAAYWAQKQGKDATPGPGNLIMDGVLCPFTMNLYYDVGARGDTVVSDKLARPVDDGTPCLRRIHFSHITAREVKHAAGFLYGLAEMPLEDISFTDVSISISDEADSGYPEMADDIPSMSQAGFFIRNARHLRLENVEVTGQIGDAFDMDPSVEAVIIP